MEIEFSLRKRVYFIKTYFKTEVCWGAQCRSYLPCLPSTGWLAGCCPRNLIKATSHNFLTGKAVKGGGRLTPPSHPRQYPQTFFLSIWNIFLYQKRNLAVDQWVPPAEKYKLKSLLRICSWFCITRTVWEVKNQSKVSNVYWTQHINIDTGNLARMEDGGWR